MAAILCRPQCIKTVIIQNRGLECNDDVFIHLLMAIHVMLFYDQRCNAAIMVYVYISLKTHRKIARDTGEM